MTVNMQGDSYLLGLSRGTARWEQILRVGGRVVRKDINECLKQKNKFYQKGKPWV